MQKEFPQGVQLEQLQTNESAVIQTDLFETPTMIVESLNPSEIPSPPLRHTHLLTDQANLAECALPYRQELILRGKSNYTVTCFLSDLKMFRDFEGDDTPIGRITREQVTDWLVKLKFGTPRQVPAPKTMARRITFLKNF